jgi:UDP-N-acetylmuramate-alanine ligase
MEPEVVELDLVRLGRLFHEHFLPYMPSAQVTNNMVRDMAEDYRHLEEKCKAFEDAVAYVEDRYPEYSEIDYNMVTQEEQVYMTQASANAARTACQAIRDAVKLLIKERVKD